MSSSWPAIPLGFLPGSTCTVRALWKAVSASPPFTVLGRGDSIAAARKFGVPDGFYYVCTAGGGLMRYLAGEPLPVVNALVEAAARHREEVGR